MSKLALGLMLSAASFFTLPAVTAAKTARKEQPATADKAETTAAPLDKGLRDIKPGDRKWFEETLPSKTYETPDEVMKALGWEVAPAGKTTTARTGK
jgi:hypothetical protein